jgi:hypothetical protein
MPTEKLRVRVKPGSRKGPLVERGADGVLVVYVRERAVDGAANDGVVRALGTHFGVPERAVRITAGASARIKTVAIETP